MKRLTEVQRLAAYERARKWAAGPRPKLSSNLDSAPSKYPRQVIGLVLVLCFILLIAAFIPSAIRLHKSGSQEFCQALDSTSELCNIVGISTVLTAEIGSLVFILALSVVESVAAIKLGRIKFDLVRSLLWASALSCVLMAVVGNAHIGRPWQTGILFDWLVTFIPPVLVLSVGYVLKDLLLQTIATRHKRLYEYERRLDIHLKLLEEPEQATKWLKNYSTALKEALQRANKRTIEKLQLLSRDEWEALIVFEMQEANWQINPDMLSTEKEFVLPIQDKHTWQDDKSGLWSARMPGSGEIIGVAYTQKHYATNAIKRRHKTIMSLNGSGQ